MTNRNSLLGRSRPADRLSKRDRESLERSAADTAPEPPRTQPAPVTTSSTPTNAGKEGRVGKSQLKFHWTTECPACGFKVAGSGDPQPGQRLARCGRCKINICLNGK